MSHPNTEQNQNQDPTLEQNNPPQENLQNQPTNNPPVPAERTYTESEMRTVHDMYSQALRENEQRLQSILQNQTQNNNQNQNNNNNQNDDFISNGRNIIAEEIEKRLAPFSSFVQKQEAQTAYNGLKEQFKKHPTFAPFFNIPQAESMLDQQAANLTLANVNMQSVAGLISQIYGYLQLNNMVPQPQFNQPQINNQPQQPINNQPMNNNNNNPIQPPYLRPSAPPAPTNNGLNLTPKGNVRRQLSELERRIARENRLSDDDYIDWLNEGANVTSSDIGLAPRNS
jgi:hypothetical protein